MHLNRFKNLPYNDYMLVPKKNIVIIKAKGIIKIIYNLITPL